MPGQEMPGWQPWKWPVVREREIKKGRSFVAGELNSGKWGGQTHIDTQSGHAGTSKTRIMRRTSRWPARLYIILPKQVQTKRRLCLALCLKKANLNEHDDFVDVLKTSVSKITRRYFSPPCQNIYEELSIGMFVVFELDLLGWWYSFARYTQRGDRATFEEASNLRLHQYLKPDVQL